MGVPNPGSYKEILNSDDKKYGGSGVANGTVKTKKGPMHGFDQHISLTLPPLSTLYLSVPQPASRAPPRRRTRQRKSPPSPPPKRRQKPLPRLRPLPQTPGPRRLPSAADVRPRPKRRCKPSLDIC